MLTHLTFPRLCAHRTLPPDHPGSLSILFADSLAYDDPSGLAFYYAAVSVSRWTNIVMNPCDMILIAISLTRVRL